MPKDIMPLYISVGQTEEYCLYLFAWGLNDTGVISLKSLLGVSYNRYDGLGFYLLGKWFAIGAPWERYDGNDLVEDDDDDYEHLCCPSFPNCDIDPLGCTQASGSDVEWYGHRD